MKYGMGISIDVTKIDKSKMVQGKNGGVYLDINFFIDPDSEKDQYGNQGMVTQNWRDAPKGNTPILGNVKSFWQGESDAMQNNQQPQAQAPAQEIDFGNLDIPF